MSPNLSVTRWLERLRQGDVAAADVLFHAYYESLVRVARSHLSRAVRRAVDEEDVALAALDSFFRAAQAGRFPQLRDRHDLWRLLLTLTLRKARDMANHERRQKRGGGRCVDLFDLLGEDDADLDRLVGDAPSPELAASFADEVRQRLASLPGDDLIAVVLARLEGDTVREVAQRLGLSQRAVERKLHLIRRWWQQADGAEETI